MQRTRMLILGMVALALSGVVTFLIYRELNTRAEPEVVETNLVVVAAQPLTVGMQVKPEHLKVVDWPGSVRVEGSYSDTEELLERGVLYPIQANEPVLDSKLATRGSGAGLAATIPEGKRAISVRVNDVVGVAGFVLPGTRVDVILSGRAEGPGKIDVSKVVLENVQVISAGQNIEYDSAGKPKRVPVVTLLVTPEEAQKLTLSTIDGRIQLALRNPLDLETMDPKPTRRAQLYAGAGAVPAPPPRTRTRIVTRAAPVLPPVPQAETFEVELIQGGARRTLKFQSLLDEEQEPGGSN